MPAEPFLNPTAVVFLSEFTTTPLTKARRGKLSALVNDITFAAVFGHEGGIRNAVGYLGDEPQAALADLVHAAAHAIAANLCQQVRGARFTELLRRLDVIETILVESAGNTAAIELDRYAGARSLFDSAFPAIAA